MFHIESNRIEQNRIENWMIRTSSHCDLWVLNEKKPGCRDKGRERSSLEITPLTTHRHISRRGNCIMRPFRLDGTRIKAPHLYADLYFRAQTHRRRCCCQRVQFSAADANALAENYKSMSAYQAKTPLALRGFSHDRGLNRGEKPQGRRPTLSKCESSAGHGPALRRADTRFSEMQRGNRCACLCV